MSKAKAVTRDGLKFDSITESKFALVMERLYPGKWRHHPLTFHWPTGTSYKPDFIGIDENREFHVYEVKGSWLARGASKTRQMLKVACHEFPEYHWYGASLKGKTWKIEKFSSGSSTIKVELVDFH